MPPLVEPVDALRADQIRRYSRHLLLPELGETGQRRLAAAKVLCVGAGGLGSPVLLYLAAAGVGTIGIVDFDTVEESNLQRQIIHGHDDIGRPKTQSAGDAIRRINPQIDVLLHQMRLDATNTLDVVADYDLVIDGTDNFATRYLVNDACVLLDKPYVWASIARFDGQVSVFWAEHGPCYRCVFPTPPPPGSVPSCAEGGVLGVLCGSVGSMQATEAIKLITGIGRPLVGALVHYDALDMDHRRLVVRKDPACVICGAHPSVTALIDYDEFCAGDGLDRPVGSAPTNAETISARELEGWLDARERGERDFFLVDVREPGEAAVATIPGSVLIPLGRFVDGSALAELPSDRQIVLFCRVGRRSAEALSILKNAGHTDAVHVGDGILGWVADVDPGLQLT